MAVSADDDSTFTATAIISLAQAAAGAIENSDEATGPAVNSAGDPLRDSDTGRVLERRTRLEGRDYTINALQGVVTLNRPSQGSGSDGLIQGRPGGDITVNMIAQYGFTPVGVDVDGLSYGARVEAAAGQGSALRFEIQADYADLGLVADGTLTAYFEERTEGFSTLDYQVTATTGDETLYGLAAGGQASSRVSHAAAFDRYEDGVGQERTEVSAKIGYAVTDRLLLETGVKHLDQTGYAESGNRTDLALRATYEVSEQLGVFGYAQGSVSRDGLKAYDRYGAGQRYGGSVGWAIDSGIDPSDNGSRLRASETDSDESAVLNGQVIDATLGYALRPVDNERFNMLAQARYLSDDFGQTVDGVPGAGAKLGYRDSETGLDTASLVDNDAYLVVINLRDHLVHEWDVLLEARQFEAIGAGLAETGFLGAVYCQVGQHTQEGVGYNFGSLSDDLTDLEQDDGGLLVNVVASF